MPILPIFTSPAMLTGRALTNWLRTDGSSLFRLYERGSDLYNYLKEGGVDIPRSTFYTVRRQVLNLANAEKLLSEYEPNQLIPRAWHIVDHGLDLSTRYQYRIHLYGNEPGSGRLTDRWMTVASTRQLTPDEIRDVAMSYVGEGGDSGDVSSALIGEMIPMRWTHR